MFDNERWIVTGQWSGRTARMKQMLDEWLVAHPGKKALILDPKTDAIVTRHFEPHVQIPEKKEDTSNDMG